MEPVTLEEAWDVLGLVPGATPDEMAAAYRAQAKKAHPDAGGSPEEWARLTDARSVLLASTELLEVKAYVDDYYGEHPLRATLRRWWRAVPKVRRVGLVLIIGALVLGAVTYAFAEWAATNGIPRVIPLSVMVYPALGWLWMLAAEVRRPRILPLRWVLTQPQTRDEWAEAMERTMKAAGLGGEEEDRKS